MDLYTRHLTKPIETALADTPVVVLQGARQTGKSTLVGHIAAKCGGVVHTMDDASTREAALADPETFLRSAGDSLMVIDEIQRTPDLILPLKALVDSHRRPGRFLLTGSADLLRVPGAEDSLAGRAETLRLRPLSAGELHNTHDDFVTAILTRPYKHWLQARATTTRDSVIDLVFDGGMPTPRTRQGRRRSAWIDDYAERITHRDTRSLSGASPAKLHKTLTLLAAGHSGELVKARVARGVGVSESVVSDHIDVLRGVYLVEQVAAWSRNAHARLTKKPKTYLLDGAVVARLQGVHRTEVNDPLGINALGPLLEGFVALELLKQQTWSESEYRLSHYRESGGNEVDLVATADDGRTIGIEVKATATPMSKHFNPLRTFAHRMGDHFVAGIVLHLGQQALSFGDGLLALPVSALWDHRD